MAETYQALFRRAIKKRNYERAVQVRSIEGALWRLLHRKPVDPVPGKTSADLMDIFTVAIRGQLLGNHAYISADGQTEYIKVAVKYDSDPPLCTMMPIVSCTWLDGACWHQSRIQVFPGGGTEELGIAYPFSESGVTGIDRRDLPEIYKSAYDAFKDCLEAVRRMVVENADIL